MKIKIYDMLKKYKIAIFIALGIIILGIVGLILFLNLIDDNSSKNEFGNNNYILKYDTSWKLISKEEYSAKLKHNKESTLNIDIVQLQDEYKYSTIEEMLDKLLYDIAEQNKEYRLISKKEDRITKHYYSGYKLLYEKNDKQTMIVICKKSDKLIMFTYESINDYFDILLDSVNEIIYNFDILEQSFDLNHQLKIETEEIKYLESSNIEQLLNQTKEYEIAKNNYYVKYSIPSNFESSRIDSTNGYFNFKGLDDGRISLSVSIYNKNIYEHLDKEKTVNVYSNWKFYKDDEDYSEFSESLSKLNNEDENYIYKNNFYYDKAVKYDKDFNKTYKSEKRENIVMMYTLNKNHILVIEINTSKVTIPKKLIDMIKLEFSENYSSYTDSEKSNGYLISNLKRITNYTNKIPENIILKLPEKYKEIDKGNNIYENRYYNLEYNEELEIYNYEINHFITTKSSKLESQIENINNSFYKANGEYNYLKYSGDREINGKNFKVYDGGFTELSGIMFTNTNRTKYYVNVKVLVYELDTGGYLIIRLEGNGVQIDDKILKEITNFKIKNN